MKEGSSFLMSLLPFGILISWVIKGWLFGRIAKVVGKNFGLFFALGILPIVDFIPLILLGNEDTIRCPQCAESIRKEAQKCRHCGHKINS